MERTDAFDGTQLMREIILLRSPAMVPEKQLMLLVDVEIKGPCAW
jgi:hypothetical protein